MSKFKDGDRVAVYDGDERHTGEVVDISHDGLLIVASESFPGKLVEFHPKQCRKLKPKAKKEPRRIWLSDTGLWLIDNNYKGMMSVTSTPVFPCDVEFIEVIKKGNK